MSRQLKAASIVLAVVGAFILGLVLGNSRSSDSGSKDPAIASGSPTAAEGPMELGQEVESPQGNKITAYSYEPSVRIEGQTFGQADVQWCAGHVLGEVSYVIPLWSVETDQGLVAAESYGWTTRSLGANDELRLDPGECARGLLEFAVPKGATAQNLVFSGTAVFKWAVGAGDGSGSPAGVTSPAAST